MQNSESSSSAQLNSWQQWAFRVEQKLQEQQDLIDTLMKTIEVLRHQIDQQAQQLTDSEKNNQPPVFHVDKIEYHFDQLKVDTLEGSLQIGMSTASGSQLPTMIEDLAMKQKANSSANSSAIQPLKYNNDSFPNQAANNGYNPGKKAKKSTKDNQNYQSYKTKQNNINYPEVYGEGIQDQSITMPAGFEQYLYDQLRQYLHIHGPSFIASQSHFMQIPINDEHMTLMIQDLEKQLAPRIKHYIEANTNEIYYQSARDEQKTWEQLQHIVMEKTWHDIQLAVKNYFEGKQN